MLAAPRSAAPATFISSQVVNVFFRPCRGQYGEVTLEYYRYRCTVPKRVAGTGFTNLMQHIRREHPAFTEVMLAATPVRPGQSPNT
ncbi:hypothetical protein JG688_00017681 [Phytophthora aleatoria]|uniref:Uncharacterized protein n=1 Tax=Phytophthora aleatoria TaxID=2496075 RepID=A0A8J5IWX0_9STRA|nr:hypothetical protein JG688_00017681 [Phytophthora aleatoria]